MKPEFLDTAAISTCKLECGFELFTAKICICTIIYFIFQLKSKFRTHGGKPGEFICKAAEEEGAELVICGTRGQGTIRRTFLGSVSNYLVHHSHVPVLVCRQTH